MQQTVGRDGFAARERRCSIHKMKEEPNNLKPKQIARAVCMVILLALPVVAMFWIWRDARRVPLGVLGGALFRSPWHIAHAGFCMDQPTIGKWYFWSTVFSGMWMLFAWAASCICQPCSRSIRRVYVILTLAVLAIYLLVHTVPSFWTLQYIHAMGFTHRRLIALLWGIAGYIVLLSLSALLVRKTLRNKGRIEQNLGQVSSEPAPEGTAPNEPSRKTLSARGRKHE